MTLVELLVVIVLVTTLVVTAIPVLSPKGDSRRIREASRAVNSFLAGAQARAVATGRPVGVAFERLSAQTGLADDNGVCVELRYVETPPNYAGFDASSRARFCRAAGDPPRAWRVQLVRVGTGAPKGSDGLPTGFDADLVPQRFLRPGDVIEVEGRRFTLLAPNGYGANPASVDALGYFAPGANPGAPTTFTAEAERGQSLFYRAVYDNTGASVPPPEGLAAFAQSGGTLAEPLWTSPTPYEITRQPTSTSAPALQLPSGAAIDLAASVFGNGVRLDDPSAAWTGGSNTTNDPDKWLVFRDPIVLVFSREGTIDRALLGEGLGSSQRLSTPVTSSIALCVGVREKIPAEVHASVAGSPSDPSRGYGSLRSDPIDLAAPSVRNLSKDDLQQLYDKYNWLRLVTRWVVVGAQSGSVTTVESSYVSPTLDGDGDGAPDTTVRILQQLRAALALAPARAKQGGR